MRWGLQKFPVVDLDTTHGAVVESSPKGKSNVALPPLFTGSIRGFQLSRNRNGKGLIYRYFLIRFPFPKNRN